MIQQIWSEHGDRSGGEGMRFQRWQVSDSLRNSCSLLHFLLQIATCHG